MCVCGCMGVCVRERERERDFSLSATRWIELGFQKNSFKLLRRQILKKLVESNIQPRSYLADFFKSSQTQFDLGKSKDFFTKPQTYTKWYMAWLV